MPRRPVTAMIELIVGVAANLPSLRRARQVVESDSSHRRPITACSCRPRMMDKHHPLDGLSRRPVDAVAVADRQPPAVVHLRSPSEINASNRMIVCRHFADILPPRRLRVIGRSLFKELIAKDDSIWRFTSQHARF